MEVKLFVPCFIDLLYPEVGWACVDMLERAGCVVHFDERVTCCGQPAFNSGYQTEATKVAKRILEILSEDDLPVVIPSGSCGSMVVNHYQNLALDAIDRDRFDQLRPRFFEFNEFWVTQLNNPHHFAKRSGRILLHRSCHGLRELGVGDYAYEILKNIEGLSIELTSDRDACCGFGGTFSVKFPELSVSMADAKIAQAVDKGVEAIIAGDVSCLMHMRSRAQQQGIPMQFLSVVEVMAGKGAIA